MAAQKGETLGTQAGGIIGRGMYWSAFIEGLPAVDFP